MPKIFLINVGANASHRSRARSPIFEDGTFIYVPFPLDGDDGNYPYPEEAWPFTNGLTWYQTHADPDWDNLTYGDRITNPRAAALKAANPSDILLFWALLWKNDGDNWLSFTDERAWYLIGALRIDEILSGGQSHRDAKPANWKRASENTHFWDDALPEGDAVFIGDRTTSALFDQAVPLVSQAADTSLLHQTYRTAAGEELGIAGKHWSGYTRTCRPVWDLDQSEDRERALILRDSIAELNEFDLLKGL